MSPSPKNARKRSRSQRNEGKPPTKRRKIASKLAILPPTVLQKIVAELPLTDHISFRSTCQAAHEAVEAFWLSQQSLNIGMLEKLFPKLKTENWRKHGVYSLAMELDSVFNLLTIGNLKKMSLTGLRTVHWPTLVEIVEHATLEENTSTFASVRWLDIRGCLMSPDDFRQMSCSLKGLETIHIDRHFQAIVPPKQEVKKPNAWFESIRGSAGKITSSQRFCRPDAPHASTVDWIFQLFPALRHVVIDLAHDHQDSPVRLTAEQACASGRAARAGLARAPLRPGRAGLTKRLRGREGDGPALAQACGGVSLFFEFNNGDNLKMSDSEDDDVSISGSEGDQEDDEVEMEEIDDGGNELENVISDLDDNDAVSEGGDKRAKWFQKEIWQLKKLPYYADLEKQANQHFINVKQGLANSVLLNDAAIGFTHWILELERYIELYNRRFSKEEHIQMIKLLLPLVVKGQIFRNVKIAMHALNILLSKRDFLLRGDLCIEWRPLHDLYMEVAFKSLEEDGVFLIPEGFRSDLHTLVFYARNYFNESAVQELLDECRPHMCVWDEAMIRSWKILDMFVPMNFVPAIQHTLGSVLWFDEAWHWYTSVENNSLFEPHIMKMFARISYECPGLVDWTPKLDLIFNKLIRSLRLGSQSGLCQTFNMETGSMWIVYMLGTDAHDAVVAHIKRVLGQIESFLHPSNNGSHTQHLLNFIHKLTYNILLRLKRERTEKPSKPKTINLIPDAMKLTQKNLDDFMLMIVPSMKWAIFTKTRNEFISPTFKTCTLLCPKLFLPLVLDMVYPALETLTEPHRLLQTLNTLLGVVIPLVKDQPDKNGKSLRVHAINLLNSVLPGLDRNDISKCMITYQVVGALVNLIPLVDCSEAVHLRDDLTEDERELCSATANLENILYTIMQRMIEMLVDCGHTSSTTSAHGSINIKNTNIEDSILHRGTVSVFKGICRNSSTQMFEMAIGKVYDFACEYVFDSRIVCDALSDMISSAVKLYPEKTFNRFFKLITSKLQNCITPEVFTEEKVDFHVIWWLSMASRIVKVRSDILLENWTQIRAMVDLVMPLMKCTLASEKAFGVLDSVLEQLCSVYILPGAQRRINYDKPLDEYLAIRHWAAPIDNKTWQPSWHIPNQEGIDRATELFKDFVMPCISRLSSPHGLEKKEILHRTMLVQTCILSCSNSLPLFEGPILPLNDAPTIVPENEPEYIISPAGTPVMTIDGKNVRQIVLDCALKLLDYLLEHSPDDVKSIREAISILRILPGFRGINKDMFTHTASSFRVTKLILCDRLSGNKNNIEMVVEEYLSLLHKKRMSHVQGYSFKQQHVDILKMLLRVSTSSYSENRIKAQAMLIYKMREYPYSYKYILDDILNYLDPASKATHEQIKGALYILVDGKRQALCLRMDFATQGRIWPTLVGVQHSEKPSIIRLLESAQNIIVENFESYRMRYEWKPACADVAHRLLECADPSSPLQPSTLKAPSAEVVAANANNLTDRYKRMKDGYETLIARLVQLATDPNLHWRPVDMAHAMLSMLVRRDEQYPEDGIRLFVRLLVHDAVKTRRIAAAVLSSWLKMNKPKAVKRDYILPFQEENTGVGAKFPIKYGFRDDNRVMIYQEEKLPKTDEEWDSFQFCGKQHWGFYTWPAHLKTYAPLKEQVAINRDPSTYSEIEKYVVSAFQNQEFMTKIRVLYSVEEKKGDEAFNPVNFTLFQGLFRVFNDTLAASFKEQLEILCLSTKESEQKLAAEMSAAIVNGSKMWYYAKQRKLWSWLGPLLSRTFETIKAYSLRNWGVALATMCGCTEPRGVKPLMDVLFKLLERPTDNAFAASSRLFLIQSGLCQFEWRGVELWNRYLGYLRQGIVQQYANLRDRIAVSLVSASWYDIPTIYVSPNYPDSLRPPPVEMIVNWYQEQLTPCWEEVRVRTDGACPVLNGEMKPSMSHSSSSASLFGMDSEVKRAARLTLKAVIAYVYQNVNQSYIAFPRSFIPLIPLFCHYSNDVGDEELQRSCSALAANHLHAIFVSESKAGPIVQVATQILASSCWWKAKVAILRFVKMIVFSNVFFFLPYQDNIGLLLLTTLADNQIEVREQATETLSSLIQSKFFEVTPMLVEKFMEAAKSTDAIVRHGGVLGLSAIILAFPYSVPPFLPDVLMKFCRYATDRQPIRETVKRALSEFKRTHQDSWREHESQFNEDQLTVLRDLLISPNYYV
ncbi:unnamed protein product [Caenorhabditis auriculariae]|uniref:F-box domain-containing protein n=1 Tax=Caenorhabditis auriculariae TaxID=2777116 RepID=A0A8S1HAL0_9PELO|nr:unnamed protein product [Caenorhabditis auriculariae]